MEKSTELSELAAALSKAQALIKAPIKNKTVRVTPRSGRGSYSFKYATLDAVMDAIRKPLSDNELAISQGLTKQEDNLFLTTLLLHSSGQWISTTIPIVVETDGMQALGSAISYARRYGVSSMLGLTADEDDDGNAADGNKVEDVPPVQPVKPIQDPTPVETTIPLSSELERIAGLMKRKGVTLDVLIENGFSNPRTMSAPEQESLIAWLVVYGTNETT